MTKAQRKHKKRVRRWHKADRRQLVHAAGCVEKACPTNRFRDERLREDEDCCLLKGVRVPRSLRAVFGFRVAP